MNLQEIAHFESAPPLPKKGLLSFFLGLECDPVIEDPSHLEALKVCYFPENEVLERRVTTRQIDFIPPPIQEAMAAAGPDIIKALADQLSAVGPWFYEHAYANDIYDLELDSSAMTPEEVCTAIERRLREGPGTAFARLREIYPQPA